MPLPRYAIIDAYTLEELRREYTIADAKGRVSLLKKLYRQSSSDRIPFEIARLAVEDPEVEVREWIARNGKYLDYSERRREGDNRIIEFPERNLEERLKNDPDPFVRACLRENPTTQHIEDWFRDSNHIERLALMRNPHVSRSLIEQIFDLENQQLGISFIERKELVLAYLNNAEAVRDSRRKVEEFIDGVDMVMTQGYYAQLWTYISKWPKRPKMQETFGKQSRTQFIPTSERLMKQRQKSIGHATNRFGGPQSLRIAMSMILRLSNWV